MHPDERQWAKDKAKDFAKFYEKNTGKEITEEQAQNMLLATGYRLVDAVASKGPGGDLVAVAYISSNAGGMFQKDQYYNDPFKFGNKDGSLTPEQKALPGAIANPALGIAGAAAVTGGLALGPEVVAAAVVAIRACAANPVLCANQMGIAAGEIAAGGAMPAGTGAAIAGAAATGKLIGSMDGLTAAERGFISEMVAGGRTVNVIPSSNAGRSADFLIDGKKYELKTMTDVVKQDSDGLSKAISSTAMDARGQSGDIIIDARNQLGMTSDIAQRGINRALSADTRSGSKIQSITVITQQGTVYVPRLPQ
ncbi:hypothetical protein Bsp3421_003068 [Burkholderia sp. FERM BP-3421]|uniref:CdiA C-terminal domain-containing protein n=1 Tax=Burkholderia sp. FERM BP-3421 TaxID=1494466 RepID=UPI002361302A|nr:hypothetical protein [Burkholderia sp. FERM BP-3421]WDD93023.1 hypothetical protein Bsp3421_003068 [Burkholderia sp. FERM BP-3421]